MQMLAAVTVQLQCRYSAVTVRVRCFTSPSSTENLTDALWFGRRQIQGGLLEGRCHGSTWPEGVAIFFLLYIWVSELVLENHCLSELKKKMQFHVSGITQL